MLRLSVSLVIVGLLSGCLSAEERAARAHMQDQQDIATCKNYGLKEGSEAFGNCRLQLDLARERRYQAPYFYGGYHRHGPHIGTGVHF